MSKLLAILGVLRHHFSVVSSVFQYWHFYHNYRDYFHWITEAAHEGRKALEQSSLSGSSQTTKVITYQLDFLMTVHMFTIVKELTLSRLSLTDHMRVVWFDFTHMIPSLHAQSAHWIYASLQAVSFGFYWYMFKFDAHKYGSMMHIPAEVLFEQRTRFLLGNRNTQLAEIRKLKRFFHTVYDACQVVTLCFEPLMVAAMIFVLSYVMHNFRSFFADSLSLGCFQLILTALNAVLFSLSIHSMIYVIIQASTSLMNFTMICFARLRQIYHRYFNPTTTRLWFRFPSARLASLTRRHTTTVVTVLLFNRIFGPLQLSFLVINFPTNTYLVTEIGSVSELTVALIYGIVILGQTVDLIAVHLLSALFVKRLHRIATPLVRLSVTSGEENGVVAKPSPFIKLRDRFRLAVYYERFHCRRKYGITYGNFGLVSSAAFAKFLMLYSEFIMYWNKKE